MGVDGSISVVFNGVNMSSNSSVRMLDAPDVKFMLIKPPVEVLNLPDVKFVRMKPLVEVLRTTDVTLGSSNPRPIAFKSASGWLWFAGKA